MAVFKDQVEENQGRLRCDRGAIVNGEIGLTKIQPHQVRSVDVTVSSLLEIVVYISDLRDGLVRRSIIRRHKYAWRTIHID